MQSTKGNPATQRQADLSPSSSPTESPESKARELAHMPPHYLPRVSAERQVAHLALIQGHPGYPSKTFHQHPVSWELDRVAGHYRLCTYSINSPTAFMHVTATISLHGGSIRSAGLFPRTDGTLLVEIEFDSASGDPSSSLGRTLTDLFGEMGFGHRPPVCDPVKELEIHHHPSGDGIQTIVQLQAADGRGLLFRIARAFALSGVKVLEAQVQTVSGKAQDTFFVTDRSGRPLVMERELAHLQKEICSARL